MNTTTVPVEIEPRAATLITNLGMQAELQRVLDYLRNHVEGLVNVVITWGDPYDTGTEPRIVIRGEVDQSADPVYKSETDLGQWIIASFPPEVWSRFPTFLSPLR